jgi:hypothetical protein
MKINQVLLVASTVSSFISMTAQAVYISQNGIGQVLLYPYYNVNEGNISFVSVTNTKNVAKAVKVRFREAVGGESVFDFTLYLSPEDVWVGAVSQQSGVVKLSIPADTSCTVPGSTELAAESFSAARVDPTYGLNNDGVQSADKVLARLSEGHIEIIEMAELPYTSLGSDIADAVTHDQAAYLVAPEGCAVPATFTDTDGLGAILDAGIVTASGVSQDFASPGGGLYGEAAIFNASSGVYFPYNATALKQFAASPIWWPQNTQPFTAVEGAAAGVDSGGNSIANYRTADNGSTVPQADGTINADLPDLSTPTTAEVSADSSAYHVISNATATGDPVINTGNFGGGVADGDRAMDDKASAVSAALTGHVITGTYITSGDYASDWVITLPTRYTKVSDSVTDHSRAPFTVMESSDTGEACHTFDMDYWNREETQYYISSDVGIGYPFHVEYPSLCYAANVIALNDYVGPSHFSTSAASKAAKYTLDLGVGYEDGWAIIDLADYTSTPAAGSVPAVVTGLPVLGFTAVTDTVLGTERGGVFTSRIVVDEQ